MKAKIKGFVHMDKYSDGFVVYPFDMGSADYVLVGPVEFEYDVPADFNPIAAEVAALNKQKDALADEYQKRSAAIQSRINDLLCLEAPKERADAIEAQL
jgi:hypothetical protein